MIERNSCDSKENKHVLEHRQYHCGASRAVIIIQLPLNTVRYGLPSFTDEETSGWMKKSRVSREAEVTNPTYRGQSERVHKGSMSHSLSHSFK